MGTFRTPWRLAALALLLALAGCKVALHTGLQEQEANEMLAVLLTHSLSAAKEHSGERDWQVLVEESDLGAAVELLREQGLPRSRYVSMGDMFQKQGLVSTPAEERMRYLHALSQELSFTLAQIDGVVAARVHVVVPMNDPLSDKVRPSSAAVFIKHRPEVDLRLLVPMVKDMVAHSIEGLAHEQVSLSLFAARGSAARPARPSPGGVPDAWSPTARVLLSLLVVAAVGSLAALPFLLRRQGIDWRTWLRRMRAAR